MGASCQKMLCIAIKQIMHRFAGVKDPQEALHSAPSTSAFVVSTGRGTRLGLLADTALQGKESQGTTLCSPDSYSALLHIPATAENVVR